MPSLTRLGLFLIALVAILTTGWFASLTDLQQKVSLLVIPALADIASTIVVVVRASWSSRVAEAEWFRLRTVLPDHSLDLPRTRLALSDAIPALRDAHRYRKALLMEARMDQIRALETSGATLGRHVTRLGA